MVKDAKREALQILINCASIYKQFLLNKNVLVVTQEKQSICYLEISFPRHAYLHLTGVDIDEDKISAKQFFNLCADKKLKLSDFNLKDDGTTRLKLDVLPMLLKINGSIKMLCTYNGDRPKLYTEKLAGNIRGCLGLVQSGNYYVPNTVLNTDTRDEGTNHQRVLFMMEKGSKDKFYTDIVYIAKKIIIEELNVPANIKVKIDNTRIS